MAQLAAHERAYINLLSFPPPASLLPRARALSFLDFLAARFSHSSDFALSLSLRKRREPTTASVFCPILIFVYIHRSACSTMAEGKQTHNKESRGLYPLSPVFLLVYRLRCGNEQLVLIVRYIHARMFRVSYLSLSLSLSLVCYCC